MEVCICPDSFKASLSAEQACSVMIKAVQNVLPNAKCSQLPMADGGEGTVDA